MDEHLETSWCPVCDKLIQPQRFTVELDNDGKPVPQPTQPAPTAVATRNPSPSGSARNAAAAARGKRPTRTNTGAHGLVHGTGRVKPGGGLRRDSSDALAVPAAPVRTTRSAVALPPPPPPSPESLRPATFPPKVRTLISQAQTPLYCSERCRLIDAERRACAHTSGVVIAPRQSQTQSSALHDSPVSYDRMLQPPTHTATRRSSDSSNGTDVSSLFDRAPTRSSLTDLDEDEIPSIKSPKKPADLLGSDTTSKIREALFEWRTKQPKAPYGEPQERVAPGWRANETQWRKIVYGDFDPKPRPQMPSREPTPPATPSPQPVDPAHLSPFDRLPTLASMSAPDPHAAQRELLSKMKFVRTPSTTALPTSCSASSASRSRVSISSMASPPPFTTSFSFRSQSSNGRSRDSQDEDDSGNDSEEEFIQANIKRASYPGVKRGRDALTRAVEEKQREKLKEEYAAAHLAQVERECEETRELRERGVKPQSLQERILLQGPIMGRRAAGMSAATSAAQHSWSYEDLPRHIPLYPMPGVTKPRVEKRIEQVRDDQTGEVRELEVEVAVAEPLKRLFLFPNASSSPRRHSALALSS
ncbi:hypothetical protein EXIGLDRAFT_745327 [Exidia glandulosa HHB12029]|uniref:Uncharacterized protein n=1 Tax=Exidia glandulosa HHB12029 TaxID=1314781 RepID=A0A165NKV2_EXIGL|nr:hypothetical protein EXIGLDRAFT_745327 [Exidia glandulosa HHB12029]